MIPRIVFATNNLHKIEEIKLTVRGLINILTLADINCNVEIPETMPTLEENALQKARFIYDRYDINCFADDTGLEVEALQGRPGVCSARYSCDELPNIVNEKRSEANISKLLKELRQVENRKARFRTVVALIEDNKEYLFDGIVNGVIIDIPRGKQGFGYDPVFVPEGFSKTFAELSLNEKNIISHRARAIKKLVEYLIH